MLALGMLDYVADGMPEKFRIKHPWLPLGQRNRRFLYN